MLTSARSLFHDVPGSYADPVGMAEQQGHGAVSLIVARYPDDDDCLALGEVYDCFVAVSGALVAVARSTPDYRFPVTPAAALDRFLSARDAGRNVFVSLYETIEPDCARFLETVFYAECLKLHVDGTESAALVADQLARCGCESGILELNDFSDATAPRVHLVELGSTDDSENSGGERLTRADDLSVHLDGFSGRVLLYDREKNRAAIPGRAGGQAFDLQSAIDQAARLADVRRAAAPPSRVLTPPMPSTDDVEARLAEHAHATTRHPQTIGLASLIDELNGTAPAGDRPGAVVPPATEDAEPSGDGQKTSLSPPSGDGQASALPHVTVAPQTDDDAPAAKPRAEDDPTPPEATTPAITEPSAPHPLAHALDALRVEVYGLFAAAATEERAQAHEAHICETHGIPRPVPAEQTIPYLRALLCDDPPRRWHFFKQRRHDIRDAVARKLLAFHGAHARTESPALHEITKLWSRLRK